MSWVEKHEDVGVGDASSAVECWCVDCGRRGRGREVGRAISEPSVFGEISVRYAGRDLKMGVRAAINGARVGSIKM